MHVPLVDEAILTSSTAKDVTVLGAGVAGLVAAYELERLGHRVTVIEADSRIGGRLYTHRFGREKGAPFAELGAMRIPMNHKRTLHYIAKLGLLGEIREFRTLFSDEDNLLRTDAGHIRVREAARALVPRLSYRLGEHSYRPDTLLFGAWVDACLNAVAPRTFLNRPEVGRELLDLVDRMDLRPYRCGEYLSKVDLHAVFTDHPHLRAAICPAHERLLDDVLDETSNAIFRLRGGMSLLSERLAANINGNILRGHEVVRLSVHSSGVTVGVNRAGVTQYRECDHVVCTIPFPVLRTLRLEGFDDDKMDVVRETKYWSGTKIAFHCREMFWESEGITGGASFTGGTVGQTYYPASDGEVGPGAVLLASYTIGPDADEIDKLDAAAQHRVTLEEVGRMHPRLREPGMILGTASRAWGTHRWSAGAAAIRWELDAATRAEHQREAARPQGRLFFAGDHCSSRPAWIEGAIESALEVVNDLEWAGSDDRSALPLERAW